MEHLAQGKLKYVSIIRKSYASLSQYRQYNQRSVANAYSNNILQNKVQENYQKDNYGTLRRSGLNLHHHGITQRREYRTAAASVLEEVSKRSHLTLEHLKEQNKRVLDAAKDAFPEVFGSKAKVDLDTRGKSDTLAKPVAETIEKEVVDLRENLKIPLDKIEVENKELHKLNRQLREQILFLQPENKPSLPIDMYSEILDTLAKFDSTLIDQFPRILVIGDEDSGKESLVEMLAEGRIFPRDNYKITFRAPLQVTLTDGPIYVAKFKDSLREFRLGKEPDMEDLRNELRVRARHNSAGEVSTEVIPITVKGPHLDHMTLIYFPTITNKMSPSAANRVRKMMKTYLKNPNTIILGVHDGSVEVKTSDAIDLVKRYDPDGKRSFFAFTKVDFLRPNLDRVRKTLTGESLPQALGYHAVVTAYGFQDVEINKIKDHEHSLFAVCMSKDHAIQSQLTTKNLSRALNDCFWRMVKESGSKQLGIIKARIYDLETEWKNNFSNFRQQDSNELLARARFEILDKCTNLSQMSWMQWEELLTDKLWNKVSTQVLEDIYLPAAQDSIENFNTVLDAKFTKWMEGLPAQSIEVGQEILYDVFQKVMFAKNRESLQDEVFDQIQATVVQEAKEQHSWDDIALERVKLIQSHVSEDRRINDQNDWEAAVKLLHNNISDQLKRNKAELDTALGSTFTEKWLYWWRTTEEHAKNKAIKAEIDKIFQVKKKHPLLNETELERVKNILSLRGIYVDDKTIYKIWDLTCKCHFFEQLLARVHNYSTTRYYPKLIDNMAYPDIVLFYRIRQIIKATEEALKTQIAFHEVKRLNAVVTNLLEDYSADSDKRRKVLTSRRAVVADEIRYLKQIQKQFGDLLKALQKP